MKLQGPFKVQRWAIDANWLVVVGKSDQIACWLRPVTGQSEHQRLVRARRIAAALNRDDARKATKTKLWDASCAADGWNFDITFNGEIVSHLDVAALLNKLGVTLPRRKPARKGSR